MPCQCINKRKKKTFAEIDPCDYVYVVNFYKMDGYEWPLPNFLKIKVIKKMPCDNGTIMLRLENDWCFTVNPEDTHAQGKHGDIFTDETDSIQLIREISGCMMSYENRRLSFFKTMIRKHIGELQKWRDNGQYGIIYVCWEDNPEPVYDDDDIDLYVVEGLDEDEPQCPEEYNP